MKIKNIIIALLIPLILCSGCSDWLSVQPIDRQTESQLFTTKGGFYTALNGVYNQLTLSSLYGKTLTHGTMSILERRYVVSSSNKINSSILNWEYGEENVDKIFDATWTDGYNSIINCNLILKNCELQKKNILSERDYNIIKGEALSLRAFIHFDLFRLFGPVYKTGADKLSIPYNDQTTAQTLPFLKSNDFITRILHDIEQAEELLSLSDPIFTEGVQSTALSKEDIAKGGGQIYRYRQMRFNYFALVALKARVNLYAGDTQKALMASKQIINHAQREILFPFIDPSKLLGNFTTPDRVFSSECLFGLYNSERGLIYKSNFSTETASTTNLLQPRSNFVAQSLFKGETSDFRYMTQWEKSSFAGNTNEMFTKYREIIAPTSETTPRFYSLYYPLMRLSEMYYIAAECEPDLELAKGYFNTIRQKRGINSPTTVTNKIALDFLINNEYNREFAGEGQLLYLYKRKNINMPIVECGSNTFIIVLNDARVVIPIPSSEVGIR